MALPAIQRELGSSTSELQWTIAAVLGVAGPGSIAAGFEGSGGTGASAGGLEAGVLVAAGAALAAGWRGSCCCREERGAVLHRGVLPPGKKRDSAADGYARTVADPVALVVVDMQRGFDDPGYWGRRDNPACEEKVATLIGAWRERGQPVVFVRHDSKEPLSPLRTGEPGNAFKEVVSGEPDLLVTKHVNSAFHGDPDLAGWLRATGVEAIVVCGIQTNMCCETTARVGANLGFDVRFALDATHTFDLADHHGGTIPAEELARVTAANLDPEFGRVLSTADAIAELDDPTPSQAARSTPPRSPEETSRA